VRADRIALERHLRGTRQLEGGRAANHATADHDRVTRSYRAQGSW
jgi:hypothetical protein